MSNIYVACGGSSVASGIYEGNVQNTIFFKVDDPFFYGIYLMNGGTTWDLIDSNGDSSVLYRLSTAVNASLPVSATSWTSISGISPPIQTYEFVTGNTEISILVADAWSPVNGTYVWSNSISIGGGVGTVSGYYKGSGANLIAIYWATNMWKIVSSAGTVLYNGDFQSTSTTPPVSNYSGTEEYWTGVGSLTETPTSRASVTCNISGGSESGNFFVRRSNNQNFINFRNSTAYIRKQQ